MSDLLGPSPLARLLGGGQPRGALRTAVTGSIAPGGPPVATAFAAGDNVRLAFTAAAGQRVSVLATNVSMTGYQYGCCLGSLSIVNSAGQQVAGAGGSWVWVATDGGFLDVVSLTAGPYTLVFQPQSSAIGGSLRLTMYDVPADPAPVVAPSASGAAVTLSATTPGQNMQPTFQGRAGERVSIWTRSASFPAAQNGCCAASIRIRRLSDWSQIGGWTWLDSTSGGWFDAVQLPSDGTYVIVVDPDGTATGSATLTVYDVPPDTAPALVPAASGATVNPGTATPGQNIKPTFPARAGERISIWVKSSVIANAPYGCCAASIRVRRQSDWAQIGDWGWIGASSGAFLDTVTLPTDGTYVIDVDPDGPATGSVAITVYDVPPDARDVLVLNGPGVRLTTSTPGQGEAATFSGGAGQQVTVRLANVTVTGTDSDGCCSTKAWIAKPDGSSLTSPTYVGTGGGTIGATLPASGAYTVVVDPQGPATGGITFTLTGTGAPAVPGSDTFGPNVCASGRGLHARSATTCLQDPVNSATGAFTASASDLSLPGIGVPFAFVRSYTSADPTRGRLGQGWTDSYSASLAFPSSGDVVLHGEDGQEVTYSRQADGTYAGRGGALSVLSAVAGGFRLVRQDQLVYTFDGSGRLTSFLDRNGRGLSFTYAGAQLTAIRDSAGRQIALSYNPDGTLAKLSVPDGRTVAYGYTNGLLSSVVDPAGRTTTYAYDSAGRLTKEIDPNGHAVVQNSYGSDGRVSQQLDALGNRTTFAWDAATGTETVVDARGGRWQDVYANGVLTRRIDARGNITSFAFDGSLDETGVTAPGGSAVALAYDGRGNLTSVSSAALNATKSFAYDARNDVTSITDARGKVTTYAYDASGNLTAVVQDGDTVAQYAYNSAGQRTSATDARGGTTSFTYDVQGNLVSVTDPLGGKTTLAYDPAGRLVTCTDALGNATQYAYDAAGQLLVEMDPLGGRSTYTYDGAGNRTSVVDANGHKTTFAYDAANRLVSTTSADGGVTSYAYDAAGNEIGVTDAGGHTTTSSYDADNRLARTTSPLGEVTSYAYDADGNLASTADPLGAATSYTYDAAGRLLSETDPLGAVTSHRYDAVGNEVALVDPLGHTTTSVYDGQGRLVSTRAADGGVTAFGYDANGNLVTRTDPNGKAWTRAYDADDRLTSETTPLGGQTTYRYDAVGNLVARVDPRGNASGADATQYTTLSAFDADGRLVSVTDPLGGKVAYAYDLAGNRTAVTDENGRRTGFAYDAVDRLVAVTAPDSTVTRYAYDAAGNLVGRTDANGHTTTYVFDADNRRVGVTTPLGRRWSFSYDAAGNLSSTVDANGNATTAAGDGTSSYTYDADGRLTGIGYSDPTPPVTLSYDAAGNRTAMRDGAGTVTYTYDAASRLLTATRGADTVAYAYDPAGNVTQRSYPGGTPVKATFDGDGRLATVTSAGATTSYSYDASGRISQVALPNGYLETRSYDRAGRLVESRTAKAGSVLADFTVTLDPGGNPTTVARGGSSPVTVTYGYDSLDRLTGVCFQAACSKNNDPLVRWTYDAVGNRLTEKRGPTTTTYAYDADDELVSAGSSGYTYDPDGNELSGGGRTFSYDLAGRLVSTTSGSQATTYRYDGDGIRLDATAGSQKTSYLWDTNGSLAELLLERDGSGNLLRRYVDGAGPISMTTPSGAFYYHRDPIGSVTNVTSSTGKSQWTDLYEPFGPVRSESRNDPQAPANPIKFAGEYQDATGQYNLRAREYDSGIGRFLALDPLRWDSQAAVVSPYVYADDKPTVMKDPTGMGAVAVDVRYLEAASLASNAVVPDFYTCVATPCPWMRSEQRRRVVQAALLGWRKRAQIHYTQTAARWQGIATRIYPPNVPSYADCSAFATWAYFVAGAPDPNGAGYSPSAGWTGTLGVHGVSLGSTKREQLRKARPADLVFYGRGLPWEHVAIYVGGGQVVSHGGEAGPLLLPVDYRPDRGDIRSYL